jgi:death-on-curing protein
VWYPILSDALALHEAMLRELGEAPALLMAEGRGKLESALALAEWAALHGNADLAEQAALLAIRVAQARAFVDNNKRLAYVLAVIFLRENGHPLPAEHSMTFGRFIEETLEHTENATDVARWLRSVLR